MSNSLVRVGLMVALAAAMPTLARAQSLGIGPRFSFVRGDVPSGTPSTRFVGGTLRMKSSKRMVIELAMDYRSQTSEDETVRVRERPIQGSLLLFPVRGAFSPYLLGGAGIYTEMTDLLTGAGLTFSTVTERKTGFHLGGGAEIFIAPRAALFADYRWRFVTFGDPKDGAEPINVPFTDALKLNHKGSMWTMGVAFYF